MQQVFSCLGAILHHSEKVWLYTQKWQTNQLSVTRRFVITPKLESCFELAQLGFTAILWLSEETPLHERLEGILFILFLNWTEPTYSETVVQLKCLQPLNGQWICEEITTSPVAIATSLAQLYVEIILWLTKFSMRGSQPAMLAFLLSSQATYKLMTNLHTPGASRFCRSCPQSRQRMR